MKTRTHRPIPLALTALIALFSALAALAVSGGHDAHGTARRTRRHSRRRRGRGKELACGTRCAGSGRTTSRGRGWRSSASPQAPPTRRRRSRACSANQTDIGNAIKPFYGNAAGAALTKGLRTHILIAADLIAAAKAGDQAKVAAEQARWARTPTTSRLLSRANPRYWKRSAVAASSASTCA